MIKSQIMAGKLTMPRINDMEGVYGTAVYKQIELMFSAMWHAYLAKGADTPVSLPYWAKRIQHPTAMNQALKLLSDSGWITVSTRPNNNWSEAYLNESKLIAYVTKQHLDHIRMHNKYNKYKLTFHELDQDFGANKQKVNGKVFTVDKSCNGFAKAGKVAFQFDTVVMHKQYDLVLSQINKGIEKMIIKYPDIIKDQANYREIGTEIVDSLIYECGTYNAGPRTSDPRHRDNSGYLDKVGNPVGFKVMRGLLVIPEAHRNVCTNAGLRNKYLFIAELNGFKSGSTQSKVNFGRQCYYNATQAHDAVENLWLNRTYADINNALDADFSSLAELANNELAIIKASTYKWQVPIEIDMSASVLGYLGLLLNHKPFLDRCNITMGDLTDAWGHEVITNRNQFKTIMRQCYGSQMSAQQMWDDMDIEYTAEEVSAFNHELEQGELAVAIAFKDFLINNARMQPTMELHVLNSKVTTYCNKFHNVGETTTQFDLFDTATNSIRRVHNTETKRVPDLKSFKRYGPTGLIHGLDGGVMDNTVDAVINQYDWALPIHDAAILCCEAADYAREIYANGRRTNEPSLKYIHTHRNRILSNYFTSLNIPASKLSDWKSTVVPLIQPLTEELIINPMVLK
jgi:hypothetical protein